MSRLRQFAPGLLLVALAFHFSRMIWPVLPIEGDESGVANGVEAWARGTTDFSTAAYLYEIQPGSYHLLFSLHKITGATPLVIFGVVTAVGAAAFVTFSSLLIARILHLHAGWVAVALLTTQELTAAAAYANTNALAGAFVMAGLFLSFRDASIRNLWLAGILVGIGGFLRLDSLLLSPVVLGLRVVLNTPSVALRATITVGLAALVTLGAAMLLSGVSITAAWRAFANRDSISDFSPLWTHGWLAVGYFATLASVSGFVWLAVRKQWQLAGIALAGILPSLIIYAGNFTSPKYLYYGAPFMLLPVFAATRAAWQAGGRWRLTTRAIVGAAIGLHLAEGVLGVQTSSEDFRRYEPAPLQPQLFAVGIGAKQIRFGPGEGEILGTADGPRLRGGQFWAPSFWRREKAALQATIAILNSVIVDGEIDLIITSNYLSFRVLDGWLRRNEFTPLQTFPLPGNAVSHRTRWQRAGHSLNTVLINQTPTERTELRAASQFGERQLFLNDRGPLDFAHVTAEQAGQWKLISPHRHALLAIYSRRAL